VAYGFDKAFWDDLYRSQPTLWSGRPNQHLVAEITDLDPGRALDIGAGEGADAICLAAHGWNVTAVDISSVALERAARRALEAGADVNEHILWLERDLMVWEPPHTHFDLVSAQFFHLPSEDWRDLLARFVPSVAPAGTLLVVGHCRLSHAHMPENSLFTAEEIADQLGTSEWQIVTSAVTERVMKDHDGHPVDTQDAVLRAVRR